MYKPIAEKQLCQQVMASVPAHTFPLASTLPEFSLLPASSLLKSSYTHPGGRAHWGPRLPPALLSQAGVHPSTHDPSQSRCRKNPDWTDTLPWWLRWCRICLQRRRPSSNPRVGKISWRRGRLPTPLFLPGKSHGQRSLPGYSPRHRTESDTTEQLHYCYYYSSLVSSFH